MKKYLCNLCKNVFEVKDGEEVKRTHGMKSESEIRTILEEIS